MQFNVMLLAHEEMLRMQSEVNLQGGRALGPLLQVDSFWVMQNGYCMPCSLDSLKAIGYLLDPTLAGGPERRRRFMDCITFGTHWDTQVGDGVQAGQSVESCHKVRCLLLLLLPLLPLLLLLLLLPLLPPPS